MGFFEKQDKTGAPLNKSKILCARNSKNLKSAIKRDIEAIDFVKKITQKIILSKRNLEKIKQGQSINV